jgi:hypothetical protein
MLLISKKRRKNSAKVASSMTSTTVIRLLLVLTLLLALLCQQIVPPVVYVVVVHAFELRMYASNRRSPLSSRHHQSGGTLVVSPCLSSQMSVRKTLFGVGRLLASEDISNVDNDPVSFTDDNDSNSISPDNTSSSNVVSSFNPFQYDASSVRMNSDRIRTMSTIQPQNSDDHPTFIAAPISTATNPKSNNNSHRISIRALTMKQIMNEMINTIPDYDKVRDILQTNREFLLEVLEDDRAVQDDSSSTSNNNIYQNCTNRLERYIAFQSNMKERIQSAQNPSVKTILILYTEFVMSHQ